MGNFFSRRHPLIMQALGGLIAVIVMIPVGIYVFQSVFNSPAPETAASSYAVPPAATVAANHNSTSAGPSGAAPGASTGGAGKTYTVKMQPVAGKPGQYVFNPATLNINRGDTVNWVDADTTPHNIVGTSSNATSVIKKTAIDAGSYKVTFTAAGAYKYECQVHLPEMVGVINVSNKTSSSSGHGAAAGTTTQGITIKMQPVAGKPGQYVFNPATVSIKAGTVVNWVDVDSTPHNIVGTSNNALNVIHKTAIDATSYSVTFKTPGTYKYECQVHLPEMVGQITVT